MDNKQSIHIACEGILIGGLSLYFAKQLKQQVEKTPQQQRKEDAGVTRI
jgi:hypothetical protein